MQRLARYHWALWAGFALRVLGSFWDSRWHKANGRFDAPSSVLQAHWLIILGTLVMAAVPVLALRYRREMRASRLTGIGWAMALVFGLLQAVGAIWDTGLHLGLWQLNEAAGHLLETIGWLGGALGLSGVASAYMLGTDSPAKSGSGKM